MTDTCNHEELDDHQHCMMCGAEHVPQKERSVEEALSEYGVKPSHVALANPKFVNIHDPQKESILAPVWPDNGKKLSESYLDGSIAQESKERLFTYDDIREAINFGRDFTFTSTDDYYQQIREFSDGLLSTQNL